MRKCLSTGILFRNLINSFIILPYDPQTYLAVSHRLSHAIDIYISQFVFESSDPNINPIHIPFNPFICYNFINSVQTQLNA